MGRLKCEVVDCALEQSSTISLHTFPKDTNDAKKWMAFLEVANGRYQAWKADKKVIVICNNHFAPADFRYGVSGRRYILAGHIPSIVNGVDVSSLIVLNHINSDTFETSESTLEESHVSSGKTCDDEPKIDTIHADCNKVIIEQMECIKKQRQQILGLEGQVSRLEEEIELLKRKSVRVLAQKCKRQEEVMKRKNSEIQTLQVDLKRIKLNCDLPGDPAPADKLLSELIQRRHASRNLPYSGILREFAFNSHYISPKGYSYLRESLPGILPDKSNCNRWTKHVQVAPGLLSISLKEIERTCAIKPTYYGLSFDQMVTRQQILFDGTKMIGNTDYGNLLENPPTSTLAKSTLVCLATEINGHKSFPVAYALTDGLKAEIMAEVVSTCIKGVEKSNGNVLTVAFDGLKANFTAMEILGANLTVGEDDFQPYIEILDSTLSSKQYHVMPDACHMLKLMRNTLDKCQVLFNADGKAIRWFYIRRLLEVQEEEQLRAGNKLTSRHVNYQQKKMNVNLCVQVLSDGTATAIDFCRNIQIPGFENSEATTEFLRMNNLTFDILNSRPYGEGSKAPLSKLNKYNWSALISSAKAYYIGLSVMMRNRLVPLHTTMYGTCIKGIITALSNLELLMEKIERKEIDLIYLPTYRLGQDPLELFFGTLRRRLGCNDNPNVAELAYSLRAILCFRLRGTDKGNCVAQEDLLDCVSTAVQNKCDNEVDTAALSPTNNEVDYFEEGIDLESFTTLSLYVENVVVYVAGYVGRRLKSTLDCSDCIMSLASESEDCGMRNDCLLLMQKNRGGLFKPSEDLIHVCKVIERLIRIEQTNGIFNIQSKKLDVMVKRECIDRNVFSNLHNELVSSSSSRASFVIHSTHRMCLIAEICKAYLKIRLNYIAKKFSLEAKPVSNRNKLNKLVHFSGC